VLRSPRDRSRASVHGSWTPVSTELFPRECPGSTGGVVAGLALIFASGLLMMFAELDSFATSVVFWTKMGLEGLP